MSNGPKGKKFDRAAFNAAFDQYYVREGGYSKLPDSVAPVIGPSSTKEQFDRAFRSAKKKMPARTELQPHRPRDLLQNPDHGGSLLGGRPTEYTKTEVSRRELRYTDYKKAHTVYNAPTPDSDSRVPVDSLGRALERTLADRSNEVQPTRDEIQAGRDFRRDEEKREERRRQRWADEMQFVQTRHQDMTRRRIGNFVK